jgi:hypothetical protein
VTATYAPPEWDAIAVTLHPGYTPPSGGALLVVLGDGVIPKLSAFASVEARYGSAAPRSLRPVDSVWRPQISRDRDQSLPWQDTASNDRPNGSGWGVVVRADATTALVSAYASALIQRLAAMPWGRVWATDRLRMLAWQPALYRRQEPAIFPWVVVYPRDAVNLAPWNRAQLPALIYQAPPAVPYVPPAGASINVTLMPGYTPPSSMSLNAVLLGPGEKPSVIVMRADPPGDIIRWGLVSTADGRSVLRWGHGPQYRCPDPPPIDSGWTGSPNEPPPIPIARKVYIVMNDVSVVRLPERTPIEVLSVDLQASVDSWCWGVRMELADPTQIALLKPDGNGPKLVEITMNTYVWTAIIESRERSREFANAGVTVIGRSQTALLADDYTARRSLAVTDPYSAQQLANLEITQRALPFTIDWQGLDWVVPGGVWYYQDLGPIDVIAQIAASRGAVLQSHPSDPKLIVQSRYPVSPWSWSAGVADVALPADWITNVDAHQQSKPVYDAVIIAGQQQGVLAKVTRAASAGVTFASQVVDQLIVTSSVAGERGRNVLADRGQQEQVDMDIPLFAPGTITAGMSGLYAPLLLVDVQDPSDPWQGQSVGVTITARRAGADNKALEIWQRVSLERHLTDAH